jgi:hypothetical protein
MLRKFDFARQAVKRGRLDLSSLRHGYPKGQILRRNRW